jgi:4-amino-4-deoxy-L-arabinose transferase-like glycosyltransferase
LLGVVLLASLGLNAWMVTWGLPSTTGWAPDELLPSAVLEARAKRFSGGWHDKYPPLHFRLLAALYSPSLAADGPASGLAVPSGTYFHLFLVGRGLSVLMGVGIVLVVYLCGRRLMDERRGLIAAALVTIMAPVVLYAKLANVDVPYFFWWALSLLFLLRALDHHRLVDYLLLGATAALAVGTKDQAYGLYVLVAPLLVWSRSRRDREKGLARAIFAPELMLAIGTGALVLQAIYGLPGNVGGAWAHLRLISGPASRDFREFSNDLAGHAGLLVSTIRHLAFVMGVPAFAAAVLGILLAARRAEARLLVLLVPAASYYLFFMTIALYCYDRFVLPIAILLAFFAADALGRMGSTDRWGKLAGAAVLVYGLARAVSVDFLLANDSRYAAEEWLKANAGEGVVGAIGPPEYLPRLEGLRARSIGPATIRLEKVAPDLVVANADYAERADEGSAEQALYRGLESGTLGYTRVWSHRFRSLWLMIRSEDLADRPGQPLRSNLDKVNPEIRIYRRDTGPAAP